MADDESGIFQDGALRDLRAAGVKRLLGHCTYLEDPVKSPVDFASLHSQPRQAEPEPG